MKMSLAALKVALDPNVLGFVVATAQNNTRALLSSVSFAALVDSSTGVAGSALVAVPTQTAKVAQSGTNLASRTGFNTAIGKVNNAIAVIATYLNQAFTPLAIARYPGTGNFALTNITGTVATAGTVPAQDKTVTGVDGSGGDAMLRSEFNAAVVRARNNLASLVRAYNSIVTTSGGSTIKNNTLGDSDKTLALGNSVTATTAVASGSVATSDLATKAAADAALTALANNFAYVMARLAANMVAANYAASARIPTVLVR